MSLLLELADAFEVMVPDEVLTGTTFRAAGSRWLVIASLVDGG